MRIKIVIDGAAGMEDAARRIADLLDRVDRIRGEMEGKRLREKYRQVGIEERKRRAERERIEMIARSAALAAIKEKEGKEKSPAGDTAGDEGNIKAEELGNDGNAGD